MSKVQRKQAAGLSLIELMIALVIGSILMIGVIQVFSASRTAYQLSEGLARTQENARFAVDYLQRDIRMGGHWGCVNDQSHLQRPGQMVNRLANPVGALDFGVSIQAFEATGTAPGGAVTVGAYAGGWAPGLPAWLAGLNPLPGSDVLVLRFLANQGAPINAIVSGANTTFTVPVARWSALTSDGVANPQLFGVADCSYVDVFQGATNAGAGTVTVAADINRYTAQPSGQTILYRAESLVYYVGQGTSGQRSLFRARHNGAAYVTEELVEGVESMQLMFGRDRTANLNVAPPSGYIDTYSTASALGAAADEWRRVGAVQIGLVMSSPDSAASGQPASEAAQVRALGVRFVPPAASDGRFRSAYETSVALRNRLYGN